MQQPTSTFETTDLAEILIVDDRPENLLALEAVLKSPRFRLVRAASGREALKYLLERECALILLDAQMPGMDGFETAVMIRQREVTREVPIIFISAAYRDPEHFMKGYQTGALDYLAKPFDPDILRHKVTALIEMYYRKREFIRGAQLETQLQKEQFYSLFMQAPIPIYVTRGPEHRFEFVNEAYLKVTERRPSKGMSMGEAYPELKGQGFLELLDDVFREKRTYVGKSVVARHRMKDDSKKLVIFDLISHPWRNSSGQVEGIITFANDVTEQTMARRKFEKLAKELESALKARDDLMASVTQDLKTPLSCLSLLNQMERYLMEKSQEKPHFPDVDNFSRLLEKSESEIERMSGMVQSLLDSGQHKSA